VRLPALHTRRRGGFESCISIIVGLFQTAGQIVEICRIEIKSIRKKFFGKFKAVFIPVVFIELIVLLAQFLRENLLRSGTRWTRPLRDSGQNYRNMG
jgi:Na+/H+-dicarboxylate symporter